MEELDKLRRAKQYLEQLAQGIDPITGREVPEDSVLNQARLVRCFFYVAQVLGEDAAYMERGERGPRVKKSPFYLTAEERERVPVSETPVTISVFAQAVNEVGKGGTQRLKLPATAFTEWLVEKGFLREVEHAPGKRRKEPTPQSAGVGIFQEERQGQYGTYAVILYGAEAQRFLLDNLDDVIALRQSRRE